MDSRPAFHYVAEDDEDEQASGGLNHLAPRNTGEAPWTWKKVTVKVDSGAAENAMPRSMFPKDTHRRNGELQERKRVQRTRGRARQEFWAAGHVRQNSCGICTQEHVAGRRREEASPASFPHHTCRERLVHREERGAHHEQEEGEITAQEEGNVYVLDLFVKVPPSAIAPSKHKPMEVDAINQVAHGREQRRRVTFQRNSPILRRQEE